MARKYRRFSPEFWDEAVRMMIDGSRSIPPVARQGYCVVGLLLVTASMRSCGRWWTRRVRRAMLGSRLLRW
jgi:hypothetical protein